MPRKKPRKVRRPFFTVHSDIAAMLSSGAQRPAAAIPRKRLPKRDTRDWVTLEEDAFIEAHENKRSQRELGIPREQICLDTQRIITKGREGELTSAEFRVWLDTPDDNGQSVEDLVSAHDDGEDFSDAALHVFYLNYRWTPVDEMRQRYQSADGVERTAALTDACRAIAIELRLWAAPLSECAFSEHFMPDEMRALVLRAAGSTEPELHKGWLEWFADWLNEAAARFLAAGGDLRRQKETAFQVTWYREVSRQTSNPALLWEVGRRLFLLAFPTATPRYQTTDNYRRVVMRRLRTAGQTPGENPELS